MQRKQSYRILTSTSLEGLANLVNKFLNEGWNVTGGVSIEIKHDNTIGNYNIYHQAVVSQPVVKVS